MSRYRNRNIRNKLRVGSSVGKPITGDGTTEDSGIDVKLGFGEFVGPVPWAPSRVSSDGEEYLNERKDSFDKSSVSSISWADDYEAQATEMVKEEYERMERVLQCREHIPARYDRDEYKLWIKTFPCLSLTTQSNSICVSAKSVFGPRKNCDISTSVASRNNTTRKLPVINNLLREIYPSHNHSSTPSTTFTANRDLAVNNTINPHTLDIEFGSFLQIAPLNVPSKRDSGKIGMTMAWLKSIQDAPASYVPSLHTTSVPTKNDTDFVILSTSATSRGIRKSSSDFYMGTSIPESGHTTGSLRKSSLRKRSRFIEPVQD